MPNDDASGWTDEEKKRIEDNFRGGKKVQACPRCKDGRVSDVRRDRGDTTWIVLKCSPGCGRIHDIAE